MFSFGCGIFIKRPTTSTYPVKTIINVLKLKLFCVINWAAAFVVKETTQKKSSSTIFHLFLFFFLFLLYNFDYFAVVAFIIALNDYEGIINDAAAAGLMKDYKLDL